MEYFQIAMLHAKDWGADIVFVNRTYLGRWQMFAEIDPLGFEGFGFSVLDEKPNWQELILNSQILWGNSHFNTTNAEPYNRPRIIKEADRIGKFLVNHMAGTDTRKQYEIMWYQNVTKLYNFEHTFLIDWDAYSHSDVVLEDDGSNTFDPPIITSNVNDRGVSQWFCDRYGATGEIYGDDPLWKYGITISLDDNHLTAKGNLELLEDYILANKNVLKSLTS